MSNTMAPSAKRACVLGERVAGKLQTIAGAATHLVFTVAGGNVLITAMWGACTVTMAGANTVNVQTNPTTGDTVVCATATDLGTTDTAAGTLIGFNFNQDGTTNTPDIVKGAGNPLNLMVPIGDVESVITGAGADGAIQWYCTWIPLDDGASLVAAT
jgi:hypothetical protein